jgi:hypothetical protein
MARPRGDPAKIEAAKLAGTRQRLIGSGMLPDRVDELIEAFRADQERRGQLVDADALYLWVTSQPRRS